MFTTYQTEAPAILRMSCVRCTLDGLDIAAAFLVSSTSGHGMAACIEHREVTTRVLTGLVLTDDRTLRTAFALNAEACTGEPLAVVAVPDRPCMSIADVPATLFDLHEKAQQAARNGGPRDGDKLVAALAAYGIPSWIAEDSGVSYVIAGVDRTADEGDAHTGPKVYLYSGESAVLTPDDHEDPWTCALYAADGEFADILFTVQAGLGLDAECADAALCLAAWLDAHAERYPRV